MPEQASDTNYYAANDKYKGEKKQQWSFNKFIMKTNGSYINHPALLLQNLTYSDMETARVNFKIMAKSWQHNSWVALGQPGAISTAWPSGSLSEVSQNDDNR